MVQRKAIKTLKGKERLLFEDRLLKKHTAKIGRGRVSRDVVKSMG